MIKFSTNNDKSLKELIKFCKEKGYEYELDMEDKTMIYPIWVKVPKKDEKAFDKFTEGLK